MDWDLAIARKRGELAGVLGAMLALAAAGFSVKRRRAVLRLLRPAESALRRLLFIMARRLKPAPSGGRVPRPLPDFARFAAPDPDRVPAFRLLDPRKWFGLVRPKEAVSQNVPRVSVLGGASAFAPSSLALSQGSIPERWSTHHSAELGSVSDVSAMGPRVKPEDDGGGCAGLDSITRRIAAFRAALGDLPRAAQRMARLMERRKQAPPGPRAAGPLRPGLPPGVDIKTPRRAVAEPYDPGDAAAIAFDCHALARHIEAVPP